MERLTCFPFVSTALCANHFYRNFGVVVESAAIFPRTRKEGIPGSTKDSDHLCSVILSIGTSTLLCNYRSWQLSLDWGKLSQLTTYGLKSRSFPRCQLSLSLGIVVDNLINLEMNGIHLSIGRRNFNLADTPTGRTKLWRKFGQRSTWVDDLQPGYTQITEIDERYRWSVRVRN